MTTIEAHTVRIATFYGFAPVADPAALATQLRETGQATGLVGSIIVASEGVNGTIAGAPAAVDGLVARLRAQPGLAALAPRLHGAATRPFARWKVKVKPEIVTMGMPDVDAAGAAGIHVAPGDWNALIADPDTILIDTRNDYEVALGAFEGALDPATRSFGDFPAWFDAQAAQWRAAGRTPRIAMYCTGGIRCEKSTAYARAHGFEQVYHLRGGILAYLAEIEAADSKWRGDCFVFDERVAIGHGERPRALPLCVGCGQPLPPSETACARCLEAGEPGGVATGGAGG